jgi:hypothetical protein
MIVRLFSCSFAASNPKWLNVLMVNDRMVK